MNDLEKRIIELESKVNAFETENEKLKRETVEVVANKLFGLNIQLQQFQKDTIDACVQNVTQLLERQKTI